MTGRVIIVTGASSGIGFEVARQLAEGGNDVVLACRNEDKAENALYRIKSQLPNSLVQYMHASTQHTVQYMQVDLSSMSSVRQFVKDFISKKRKIHALVNCAGLMLNPKDLTRKTTNDGLELTMATNYFGMFLLTNLLMDYLVQTASISGDGRVVNVSCAGHDKDSGFLAKGLSELDVEDLNLSGEGSYSPGQAYKNSKLCAVLFTNHLSQRLSSPHLTVNSVDPGFVPTTSLLRHASTAERVFSVCCLHNTLRCLHLTQTEERAARDVVNLLIGEKYQGRSGKYFVRGLLEERSSVESYDVDLQTQLWRESCRLLDVRASLVEDDMDRISLGSRPDDPLLNKKM